MIVLAFSSCFQHVLLFSLPFIIFMFMMFFRNVFSFSIFFITCHHWSSFLIVVHHFLHFFFGRSF